MLVVIALGVPGGAGGQPRKQPGPFSPKNVTGGELTFTGQRFSSRDVTGGELTFTGAPLVGSIQGTLP